MKNLNEKGLLENLDLIMDVPLELTVVVGETKQPLNEVLALDTGSVVELDRFNHEPVEILINGHLIGEGEVVVIKDNFGVRITNVLSLEERLAHLNN